MSGWIRRCNKAKFSRRRAKGGDRRRGRDDVCGAATDATGRDGEGEAHVGRQVTVQVYSRMARTRTFEALRGIVTFTRKSDIRRGYPINRRDEETRGQGSKRRSSWTMRSRRPHPNANVFVCNRRLNSARLSECPHSTRCALHRHKRCCACLAPTSLLRSLGFAHLGALCCGTSTRLRTSTRLAGHIGSNAMRTAATMPSTHIA